jgi:hypothetical protein
MRIAASVMLLLSLASAASAQPSLTPLHPGDVITGKLRVVKTRHPSGTLIVAYQLVSDRPYTIEGDDFCDKDQPLTTFHLVTMTKPLQQTLQHELGKTRSVKALDVMCSETAWHVGDAVVFQWELVPGQ